ncbi:serine/threonine protein kinase [Streptacidiphilus sp. PB12-B1b]|uniref:protein kinase domain-containing protein n=1 Tax=Streptacidiphilus sp. PB12-B1b TaxID=2705012 RepID=UPI0015FAFAA5|nr:serine/threonine-protein kinase [Streptacidiphilus sp. PB12-B1b]QMU76627.1 serine/threonine protein kinase [Streptacidiphilus sp. PB12-B1b]
MESTAGTGRTLAGRYLLGDRLGRGGMGTVWRAQDQMLDREVAVKELSVGHLAEEDLQIVQSRMKQEARAAARIRHPGVITVHDVLEQDGKPWIVMELITGRSLAERIDQDGPLSPAEAAGVGAQVLAALHQGHRAGVIHRDVKPANVLLEHGTGRVVLTDFGIATYEGDSALTRPGDLIGSPDYLAPEQIQSARPGPASDLWGLGATLYTAVEGQSPFRRDSPLTTLAAVVSEPLREPGHAGPLAPLLKALLAKQPEDRPDTVEAIRTLEGLAAGTGTDTGADTATAAPGPQAHQAHTSGWSTATVGGTHHSDSSHGGTPVQHWPTTVGHGQRTEAGQRPTRHLPESDHPHEPMAPVTPAEAEPARRAGAATSALSGNHRGRRRRRSRTWPVAAGLAVVLAACGVAYEVGHQPSGTPAAAGTPSAHPTTPPPSAPPAPPGYTLQRDPAGFSFPLPTTGKPWVRSADGLSAIRYTPDGQDHLLTFGVTPGQGISPLQHAQQMAKEVVSTSRTYRLVSLNTDTIKGYQGARWEFTFSEDINGSLQQRHAIEQFYKDSSGTEYAIYLACPESDWSTGYAWFLQVVQGFTAP